jgi:peptide/nickel transport system permease protein
MSFNVATSPAGRLQGSWRALGKQLSKLSRVRATTLVGGIVVVLWILVAVFAPLIAPYSFTEFHMDDALEPPSAQYPLGTDRFGRDVLSRIIMGSRDILTMAPTATVLGVLLGVLVGSVAGYYGGLVDEILMRMVDATLAFPSMLLALLVVSTLGPTTINIIITVAIIFMPRVSRVVRSAVLDVKSKEFVEAALLRGESTLYVISREILPNCMGPIIVEGSVRVSYAIFIIASLGFLGMGQPPPSPDWGMQVSDARTFILYAPWTAIFPAAAIASFITAFNLLTDGLRRRSESRGEMR